MRCVAPLMLTAALSTACVTAWHPVESIEHQHHTLEQHPIRVTTIDGDATEVTFVALDGPHIVGTSASEEEEVRLVLSDVEQVEVERVDHVMTAVAWGVPTLAVFFGVIAGFIIADSIN